MDLGAAHRPVVVRRTVRMPSSQAMSRWVSVMLMVTILLAWTQPTAIFGDDHDDAVSEVRRWTWTGPVGGWGGGPDAVGEACRHGRTEAVDQPVEHGFDQIRKPTSADPRSRESAERAGPASRC